MAPDPAVQQEDFPEIPPALPVLTDLRNGTPEFRKYIDQLREDLTTIFVPEPPLTQHFNSYTELKFYLGRILRVAGIWRQREYDEIIVLG